MCWRCFYLYIFSGITCPAVVNLFRVKSGIIRIVKWNQFKVNNKDTITTSITSLVSLLLTWNRFYTLLWCLRCSLWTDKGWLGSDVVVRKSNVNSLWDFGNQRFSVVFKSSRNELILLDSLKFPVDFRVDSLSNLEYFLVKLQPTVIQLYEKGICLSCFIWDWDFYQNVTLASTNKLKRLSIVYRVC